MKKSEYRKGRREAWEQVIARSYPSYESVETLVARDEEACDAAGVVWDPEEEPLPEKLAALRIRGATEEVVVDLGCRFRCLTTKEAREAVRRYNAWPELIAAIEPAPFMDEAAVLRRLNEAWKILRGS